MADCFHVIRMISHHFMEFCRQPQESIRWKSLIIRALRERACNLTSRERLTLQELFELNPAIGVCHEFKEKLGDLLRLKSRTVKQCRRNIGKLKEMMRVLEHEALEELKKIGVTIRKWSLPIIRMWRYRKMKLIQRRAYGYQNFENYRLKVLVECGGFNL